MRSRRDARDFQELMRNELRQHDRQEAQRCTIDFHELMKSQLRQHDRNEAQQVIERKRSQNLLEYSPDGGSGILQ